MKHQRPSQFIENTPFPSMLGAPMADVFGRGASMFGRSFATLQKEGVRFWNQRLEDNARAVEQFGSCKSMPDLFAAQQKWFADTTRAYLEEWQRCGELMTDMVRDAGEEAEQKHSRPDETH